MKTKFTSRELDITNSSFIGELHKEEILELYYLKHYKKNGWKLDKETGVMYMIFDEPLYFNLDDEVLVGEDNRYTIIGKTINLTDEYIEYEII